MSQGSLEGWTSHAGGIISLFEDNYSEDPLDEGETCLLVSDRENWHSGPEYSLTPECFPQGYGFRVSARIKLAIDAKTNYQAVACDRTLSGHDAFQEPNVCPILTFRITEQDGHHRYVYGSNTIVDEWKADEWNEFVTDLFVPEIMGNSTQLSMYFERVGEGIDMLIDHVQIEDMPGNLKTVGFTSTGESNANYDSFYSTNCTHIVSNADFEVRLRQRP